MASVADSDESKSVPPGAPPRVPTPQELKDHLDGWKAFARRLIELLPGVDESVTEKAIQAERHAIGPERVYDMVRRARIVDTQWVFRPVVGPKKLDTILCDVDEDVCVYHRNKDTRPLEQDALYAAYVGSWRLKATDTHVCDKCWALAVRDSEQLERVISAVEMDN